MENFYVSWCNFPLYGPVIWPRAWEKSANVSVSSFVAFFGCLANNFLTYSYLHKLQLLPYGCIMLNVCPFLSLPFNGDHSHTASCNGGGGLLIFVTKDGNWWVGCFWNVMPHFLYNSRLSTLGLKIAILAIFWNKFCSTSKSNLVILFSYCYGNFHYFISTIFNRI